MWGREATGVALKDDEALIAAIGPLAAPAAPRRKPRKRVAARRRR
jgi:hypothetical protein